MKVHSMFGIGKRDMDADAVNVRDHGKGNLSGIPHVEAITDALKVIMERRPS